jgi:hypothetical protein
MHGRTGVVEPGRDRHFAGERTRQAAAIAAGRGLDRWM